MTYVKTHKVTAALCRGLAAAVPSVQDCCRHTGWTHTPAPSRRRELQWKLEPQPPHRAQRMAGQSLNPYRPHFPYLYIDGVRPVNSRIPDKPKGKMHEAQLASYRTINEVPIEPSMSAFPSLRT